LLINHQFQLETKHCKLANKIVYHSSVNSSCNETQWMFLTSHWNKLKCWQSLEKEVNSDWCVC